MPLSRRNTLWCMGYLAVGIAAAARPLLAEYSDAILGVTLLALVGRAMVTLGWLPGWARARSALRLLIHVTALASLLSAVHSHASLSKLGCLAFSLTYLAGFRATWPLTVRAAVGQCLVGYGLCLLTVLKGQHEDLAAFSLIYFLIGASILYLIHYPDGYSQFLWRLVTNVLKMTAIIGLALGALILCFPRFRFELTTLKPGASASIGFGSGTELNPAEIDSLATSERIAFRARFDGPPPPMPDLYWRGTTLSFTEDGFHWFRLGVPADNLAIAPGVGQTTSDVILEPRFEGLFVALDVPLSLVPAEESRALEPRRGPGQIFFVKETPSEAVLYHVVSIPRPRYEPLPDQADRIYRLAPKLLDPRIKALARSLARAPNGGRVGARDIANRLMTFFRHGFRYRLDPGKLVSDADRRRSSGSASAQNAPAVEPLATFLFERREGFCGHFATAFATLARLAGVPSRVVMGFHGGELNALGDTLIVRDRDAHAWVEIWDESQTRWLRYDPTLVVAPKRLGLGAAGFLAGEKASLWNRPLALWDEAWETATDEWSFFRMGGKSRLDPLPLRHLKAWAWVIIASLALLFLLFALRFSRRARATRPGTRQADELGHLFERFSSEMGRLGVVRRIAEGPSDFLARIEASLPGFQGLPREFTRRYIELRYAVVPDRTARLRELKRVLKSLRKQAALQYPRR